MNNNPLVSILLPNLNTRPYLEERMATILNQTYTNWELIIADSYSDDGSWEYLSQFPAQDARISAYQIPKGLYQAWNFCIEKAKGEYIYIATSDDTMVPECIEKMVTALEAHPECDICDSKVMVINEYSQEITESDASYPIKRSFFKRFGNTSCIRLAPYDFFEQLNGETIYISITQIMIRRKLFDKTGLFPEDLGHIGDFIWGVRAGRSANVIYLPEKLGSWRIHSGQVSKGSAHINILKANHILIEEIKMFFSREPYKKRRAFLRVAKFRHVLLAKQAGKVFWGEAITWVSFFAKYPEEILLCPFWYIYRLLFSPSKYDTSKLRWEMLISCTLKNSMLLKKCNSDHKEQRQ